MCAHTLLLMHITECNNTNSISPHSVADWWETPTILQVNIVFNHMLWSYHKNLSFNGNIVLPDLWYSFFQNATSTLSYMPAVSSLCNLCRFRYLSKSARLKIILSLRRNPLTLIQRWYVRKSHAVEVYSVTSDTSKWKATYYSESSQWSTGWHHQTGTVTCPHCLLFRWRIMYLHFFFPCHTCKVIISWNNISFFPY